MQEAVSKFYRDSQCYKRRANYIAFSLDSVESEDKTSAIADHHNHFTESENSVLISQITKKLSAEEEKVLRMLLEGYGKTETMRLIGLDQKGFNKVVKNIRLAAKTAI